MLQQFKIALAWLYVASGLNIMEMARNEQGAFQIQQIMGVIFAVIIVVVGLVMFPLILNETQAARTNAYISNFAGTQAIIDLIPLLYAVGVLGLAGTVAVVSIRAGR